MGISIEEYKKLVCKQNKNPLRQIQGKINHCLGESFEKSSSAVKSSPQSLIRFLGQTVSALSVGSSLLIYGSQAPQPIQPFGDLISSLLKA